MHNLPGIRTHGAAFGQIPMFWKACLSRISFKTHLLVLTMGLCPGWWLHLNMIGSTLRTAEPTDAFMGLSACIAKRNSHRVLPWCIYLWSSTPHLTRNVPRRSWSTRANFATSRRNLALKKRLRGFSNAFATSVGYLVKTDTVVFPCIPLSPQNPYGLIG